MLRSLMKSKIHGATVTEANLRYTGSITIDGRLLAASDIREYERVQIVNLHNGSRVETYVMEGRPGSGIICMNGAAARWAEVGDRVIIISYALLGNSEIKKHRPKIIFVDEKNRPKHETGSRRHET
ncbi:MAG: aspartate 1-decarboxylase [Candidatus Omnitrophica bacterium]|nr:aspartate 1-decarboxylase [Candidatus Omnitrophota bacterium]